MSDLSKNKTKGKLWEWLRRYRQWQANRKVFLSPENYLEPEPRDDKTPLLPDDRKRPPDS
jgi:hypothetical protein